MASRLGEKNPKWLQDDYVKFLRFAQWKIEQAETRRCWDDHQLTATSTIQPCRGMRQSLMHTFDDIYNPRPARQFTQERDVLMTAVPIKTSSISGQV